KGWPAAPRILATRLRALASSLGKTGIDVAFNKVGHDRTRLITLSRRQERPVQATAGLRPGTSGEENFDARRGEPNDAQPETEKAVDTSAIADGADAANDAVNKRIVADGAGAANLDDGT